MKKILVSLMAVVMLLSMTACGKKCDECGEKIKGDGYEADDKIYCDAECFAKDALSDLLG